MQEKLPLLAYHLNTTNTIKPTTVNNVGSAYVVDQTNFSALSGVTCYALELWDESMRLPHWHPNASELGYVVSGSIEIMIWRSPGESAVCTLTAGMCWFIPMGALHSLNNIGKDKAQLLVGFSSEIPQDIDLPVAWNGIPVPLRDAYTSPHQDLQKWKGVINNPLVGKYQNNPNLPNVLTASPYGFDLAKVPPLFQDDDMGSVVWGVKSNWNILQSISVLRAQLRPGVARDAIWYPDAGTLYVVAKGSADFHLIITNDEPKPFSIKPLDYIYVPNGVLHTFINNSDSDFEIIAFFTQENPLPEISLSVSTSFFPNNIRRFAMTQFSSENKSGDPFKNMNYTDQSPYLVRVKK
jgi:oxalate decarboxylase/phosphoglucose isomerase-like protein (cupin superfamily)